MEEKMELEMLNAKAAQRVAEAEAKASKETLIAERKAAQRAAYTAGTVKLAAGCLGVGSVAYMMVNAGAITPATFATVSVVALGLACLRVGVWFGWVVKK